MQFTLYTNDTFGNCYNDQFRQVTLLFSDLIRQVSLYLNLVDNFLCGVIVQGMAIGAEALPSLLGQTINFFLSQHTLQLYANNTYTHTVPLKVVLICTSTILRLCGIVNPFYKEIVLNHR